MQPLLRKALGALHGRIHDVIHPTTSAKAPRRVTRKKADSGESITTPVSAPDSRSLTVLREAAAHCRDCPLWKDATQTVFGEGRKAARIMLIGEQPGDREDLAGKPFVGPAGQMLDRALEQAGVERTATYVTNAVKHFKFEPRGKRRIHKTPNELEITACHQWLARELRAIEPELVIALGGTAARAVFGRATAIGKNRGHIISSQPVLPDMMTDVLVTVHPSYLLRVPDGDRDDAYAQFVADLKLASKYAPA
jgi:DNA polymerase